MKKALIMAIGALSFIDENLGVVCCKVYGGFP